MNIAKKWILTTVLAGSMIGGAVGGTLIASSVGQAATATTTSTTTTSSGSSTTPSTSPSGTFHSNEDATHEAGESAAREAQEDAGYIRIVVEPAGAKLRTRRSGADFDPYLEVVVEFDDANDAARAYAIRCDREAPTRWDQTAGTALASSLSQQGRLAAR